MEKADLTVSLDSSTGRSAREGTGPRRKTGFITNGTVDRLARMPGMTDKTKHIQRGRDRVTDGH